MNPIGLEIPLNEMKKELLEDEVSVSLIVLLLLEDVERPHWLQNFVKMITLKVPIFDNSFHFWW